MVLATVPLQLQFDGDVRDACSPQITRIVADVAVDRNHTIRSFHLRAFELLVKRVSRQQFAVARHGEHLSCLGCACRRQLEHDRANLDMTRLWDECVAVALCCCLFLGLCLCCESTILSRLSLSGTELSFMSAAVLLCFVSPSMASVFVHNKGCLQIVEPLADAADASLVAVDAGRPASIETVELALLTRSFCFRVGMLCFFFCALTICYTTPMQGMRAITPACQWGI